MLPTEFAEPVNQNISAKRQNVKTHNLKAWQATQPYQRQETDVARARSQ
jgi:hypothetical protein